MTLEQALEIAAQQMTAGNYRAAQMILSDILKALPDNFDALHFYGLAQYYLGDINGAIKTLQQASRQEEATAECWSNLGSFLAFSGLYADAGSAFDKAILINPSFPDAYWNKANTLWLDKKYPEAESAGRTATELMPEKPEAWLNLGLALASLGKTTEAEQCWEKALELKPDFSIAWNNLGNLLRDLSRPIEAEEKCLQALKYEPENIQALNNLGNALFDQSRLTEAETLYRKAIALKPDYAEAHNNLAVCLIQQQSFSEAATEARYAVLFEKGYAEAYMNMGRALRALGEFEKAEQAIQQAAALHPNSAPVKIELADTLLMLDRNADAELILHALDNIELESPRDYLRLASIQELAGEIDKALDSAQKAIDISPQIPGGYIRKGQIAHLSGDIVTAELNYNKAAKIYSAIPALQISLADLHLSNGDAERAEAHIRIAQKLAPNLPGVYSILSKIKTFTTDDPDFKKMKELESNIEKHGIEGAATLYFAMFNAYESMHDYQKAFLYLTLANNYKHKIVSHHSEHLPAVFAQAKESYNANTFKELENCGDPSELPVFILGMPRSGSTLTEQIIAAHPKVYAAGEILDFNSVEKYFDNKITKDNCADIGAEYIKRIKAKDLSGQALRISNKLPGNFLCIGKIISTLPNAKIIHCRRNPLDIALSCYKQNFARGHSWAYSLEDIAEQYKLYEDLMNYWRNLLPGKFLEIDYEDTVSNLEVQARKIINYIGLEWNDACLEPHKHNRTVLTASKVQVRQPIYSSSVNSWKLYEKELEPLIEKLGRA